MPETFSDYSRGKLFAETKELNYKSMIVRVDNSQDDQDFSSSFRSHPSLGGYLRLC
jgi:hypothetical protein